MRALRKIVFVNSAHIRYAEVKLDGNVHFIGTQGVGKSTLLRAILFFYNADKLHLGIPKEMKSFDEFYLPHANSYIVYEVEHEHGPFSVLVFRNSGRACYRFIDAPFSRDFLVDEHGEVTAEVKVIRERLGGVHMSKIVDRYELYRDIIYGNHVAKEFARFQLMETARYQNIPRSIQNVFLNSRLDADFIKDIIIRSMSEEEANIDLGYFRRQVADFESEYRDISCWYRVGAKGESSVRKQADAVVGCYHALLNMLTQVNELCGALNYSVRVAGEQLPLLEQEIHDLTEKKQRQERLLGEVRQKYDDEKAELNREQGVVNDTLKRLNQRRAYYADVKIEEVLSRCDKEELLVGELSSLREKLAELTARYNDVTAKYKALIQTEKSQLESFVQSQNARKQTLAEERLAALEKWQGEYFRRKEEIESACAQALASAGSAIETIRAEREECEKEFLKLASWEPFKDEVASVRDQLNNLALTEKEIGGKIAALRSDISRIQVEYEKEEAALTAEYEKLVSANRRQSEELVAKVAEIDGLLAKTKGSLFEWLEENKSDWEHTIGKVINEEQVLYQTGLRPQKAEGNSFYGVQIELVDLPQRVRKPKELEGQKKKLEAELAVLSDEFSSLQHRHSSDVESLKRSFSAKIKELRLAVSRLEAESSVIPQNRKSLNVQLEDYISKGKQQLSDRRAQLEVRRQEISHRLTVAEAYQKKLQEDRLKQLKQAGKMFSEMRESAETDFKVRISVIDKETDAGKEAAALEVSRLEQQQLNELKGRGADTSMVDQYNQRIKAVEDELSYIKQNRELVYAYRKDKEELFDNEESLKLRRKGISDRLQNLSEKYALKQANYNRLIAGIVENLSERSDRKRSLEEDLRKFDNFVNDDSFCPVGLLDFKELETLDSPGKIIDNLKSIVYDRQQKQNRLKENINVFKGNFTIKNTFNFPMNLTLDEDYYDFANNLDDFLINNKLEEYRRRTSERYVDILQRVSKEMGELSRHESDVEKIINDINNDFRERNFVGVIKLIALKSVPSSDKMVQLMRRIKEFSDENTFAMGELNLFSSSNRDEVNQNAVDYLLQFMKALGDADNRQYLTLSDLFQLQFRIVENDNDTGWADKLSHVGSEGTDTLVKAMINIMLINVFKEKVSRRFGDFKLHCMMDEIGKLHPQNVKGILDFANARNILLINSSPTTYNVSNYRYTYLLSKDDKSRTVVHPLISRQ